MADYLSPEQISAGWKLELGVKLSPETIYPYIWADQKSSGELYKFLRTKGNKSWSPGSNQDQRGRINNAVCIDVTSQALSMREGGDW
ncbi:hypothetical protein CMK14_25945 [Candidatus Poribacteria bacterium]|nr:hypothetical protein [Candidatus Poribacteria bacterium]